MHRVHLVIEGRVQGVGFRYFVLRRAQSLKLNGWVCNRPGGVVEVEAEGERDSIERLVGFAREGPPSSCVSHVLERWSESAARHDRFVIRSEPADP